MRIKALQEPDNDRRKENDRKCTRQEILCLVPDQTTNTLRTRETIVRQLHNKRNRFPAECCMIKDPCKSDTDHNAGKIQDGHNKRAFSWEKGSSEERIDLHLRRAAHKRCQKHGQLTITLRRKRSCRHNCRYRAAESDDHRDEASSGQTDLTEQLVHHKRNARHIAAVLQK